MKITIEPPVTQMQKELVTTLRNEIRRLLKETNQIYLVRKSGGVEIFEIEEIPKRLKTDH